MMNRPKVHISVLTNEIEEVGEDNYDNRQNNKCVKHLVYP